MTIITICADDYGLHPSINQGIIHLVERGVVHAVSCMSTAPDWPNAAQVLRSLHGKIDIGLHLNFTEGFGASSYRLSQLIWHSYVGLLSSKKMRINLMHAIRRQLDAFSSALGHLPDMIDGHQHVHQFPVIRDVLLESIVIYYGEQPKIWVRNTAPLKNNLDIKARLLQLLGGAAFARDLKQNNIRTNRGFLGVYGFDAMNEQAYGQYMSTWLKQAQNGCLLMCHPADQVVPHDVIGKQRRVEYTYLISSAFNQLCEQRNIYLSRLAK